MLNQRSSQTHCDNWGDDQSNTLQSANRPQSLAPLLSLSLSLNLYSLSSCECKLRTTKPRRRNRLQHYYDKDDDDDLEN